MFLKHPFLLGLEFWRILGLFHWRGNLSFVIEADVDITNKQIYIECHDSLNKSI